METVSHELEAVAAALARLRTATGPVARVQAVRAAARSMQGLSSTDTQVLARGLIEHGAPAAGHVLARHGGDAVPAGELVSIAQGLLALDPGEADRFAAELRDPHQRARLAAEADAAITAATAGWDPPEPRTDARRVASSPAQTLAPAPAPAPPPIPVAARARPRPTASPQPRDDRPASTPDASASTVDTEREVAVAQPRPAQVVEATKAPPRAEPPARLLAALQAAPDARARFALLDDVQDVCATVAAGGAVALLDAVPDGWQRRTVLRRLLDATAVAIGDEAPTLVGSFARRGDRFAAASLLHRYGVAHPDGFHGLLDHRSELRLRARAADRAAGT